MSTLSRSMKNVFGKKARTLMIVVIIGFSLGVFLSMSIVSQNISDSTSNISEHMERTATITPAGVDKRGTMNESELLNITTVDNVETVQMMAIIWHFNETSPGNWIKGVVQGMDPGERLMLVDGAEFEIESGRSLQASDSGAYVAIIGTNLSGAQDAGIGASINLSGAEFEVVGIFSSGTRSGDATAIVPYDVAKEAYNITGPQIVYVTADSVGNVETMVEDLRETLGEDFDVVSPTDQGDALQESIDAIRANSQVGALIALVTGITVMILIMILITRERFREIGVLKAIGFRNSKIIAQLMTESMTLAALGFVVGLLIVALIGPSISSIMVDSGAQDADVEDDKTGGGKGGGGKGEETSPGTEVEFKLDPILLLVTLGMALLLGVLGSLYPVLQAIRLKPAEALRYE
jgi:putative ABC transport system permease protein